MAWPLLYFIQMYLCRDELPENGIPCELFGVFGFESGGAIQLLHNLWSSKEPSEVLSFFLDAQREDTCVTSERFITHLLVKLGYRSKCSMCHFVVVQMWLPSALWLCHSPALCSRPGDHEGPDSSWSTLHQGTVNVDCSVCQDRTWFLFHQHDNRPGS